MLTAIEIENFKGVGSPVRVDLRPITLLFGPNSAGKSTILHALHYAHEILSRRNFDPDRTQHGGEGVDLGGFRNFVHRHESERTIRLRFELDLSGRSLVDLPTAELGFVDDEADYCGPGTPSFNSLDAELQSGWIELSMHWSAARSTPILVSYEVGANGVEVGRIEASPDGAQVELVPNLLHPLVPSRIHPPEWMRESPADRISEAREAALRLAVAFTRRGLRFGVEGLGRSSLPRWGEALRLASSLPSDYDSDVCPSALVEWRVSTLMVGLGQLLRDEIACLRYLGPMRDVLPRSYEAARHPEPNRWSSGLAAWDLVTARGSEFAATVSDWLGRNDRLDTGYRVEISNFKMLAEDSPLMIAIRQGTVLDDIEDLAAAVAACPSHPNLHLVDAKSGVAVKPFDVGVGISQVLPVVVAALDPDRPAMTAIEQPELHIHPKVQVELADLFAQQAADGRIFLLETHSEHLMLRLLRRIEQTSSGELPEGKPALHPGQVSVVFVEQVDSEVKATPLRIDETGEFIDRWPQGFFEERAEELF